MTELEYKLYFAKLLQRVARDIRLNPQPLIAKKVLGKECCLANPLLALQVANEWPVDAEVLAEVDRLDRLSVEKEIVIGELFRLGTNLMVNPGDRVKALSELGKLMGWGVKKDDGTAGMDKLKELASMILTEDELPKLDSV
jgi:hypothetical protein